MPAIIPPEEAPGVVAERLLRGEPAVKWVRRAGIVLAVLGVPFLIVWHEQIWWWIEIHTGTVHESGPYYGFFSGFGSDLGEYAILTAVSHGVYLHWKAINCHDPGCWRVARYPVAGGQFKVCAHHHPDGKPQRHHIHAAHRAHQERIATGKGERS